MSTALDFFQFDYRPENVSDLRGIFVETRRDLLAITKGRIEAGDGHGRVFFFDEGELGFDDGIRRVKPHNIPHDAPGRWRSVMDLASLDLLYSKLGHHHDGRYWRATELLPAGVNLNGIVDDGHYHVNGAVNRPPHLTGAANWFYLMVMRHNDEYIVQQATDFHNVAMWQRVKNNGVWAAWRRFAWAT